MTTSEGLLGNHANFASPPPPELEREALRRLHRWALQDVARRLLPDEHRIRGCLRWQQKGKDAPVWAYRRPSSGAVYYDGLQTCASVWACPCCSAKISERRRQELRPALAAWRARGGEVLMQTLTVPHKAHHDPFALVDELARLVRLLNSGKRALSALVPGYVGQIRALEVTHGANGWHPHLHVLLLLRTPLEGEAFTETFVKLYLRWVDLVAASPLELGRPSPHAFSLQDGSAADDYVAKWGREPSWGAAEEVTKAISKVARNQAGRTPFALLADAAAGDVQAGRLFTQYAEAFRGHPQLRWSRGLRKELGLGREKSDEEEAAPRPDAADELAASIAGPVWRLILRRRLRGQVSELLRTGTWADVLQLLEQNRNATAAPLRYASPAPELGGSYPPDACGPSADLLALLDASAGEPGPAPVAPPGALVGLTKADLDPSPPCPRPEA